MATDEQGAGGGGNGVPGSPEGAGNQTSNAGTNNSSPAKPGLAEMLARIPQSYLIGALGLDALGLAKDVARFDPSQLDAQGKAQLDILNRAYRQDSELKTIQENLVGALGEGGVAFGNILEGSQETYRRFFSMTAETGTSLHSYFKNAEELVGEYTRTMSSNLLQTHALKEDISAADMASLTLQSRALGFNNDMTAKFLERQFALTGEANDDLLRQTLAYSNAIEDKTGFSSKIIAGHIGEMMSNVSLFGNMTVEEMSEAAAAIAQVGLEVQDVAKIVGKFNSFEDAAQSVSKLTQVFGVQLDTMELMRAANESPEELPGMLQEAFEMAGVDMSSMDMPAKRMLASALGGIGVDDVEKLLGPAGEGLARFTAGVQQTTSGVSTDDIRNSLRDAENDLARINRLGNTIQDGLNNATVLAQEAMVSGFAGSLRTLQDEMIDISEEGASSVAAIATTTGSLVESILPPEFINSIEEGTSALGETTTELRGQMADIRREVDEINESSLSAAQKMQRIRDLYENRVVNAETPSSAITSDFSESVRSFTTAVQRADASRAAEVVAFQNTIDSTAEIAAIVDSLDQDGLNISEAALESLSVALGNAIRTTPVAEIKIEMDEQGFVNAVVNSGSVALIPRSER